jgi:hypothetical protein
MITFQRLGSWIIERLIDKREFESGIPDEFI